jgi:type II secretory pathway component HofQ
VNLSSQRLIRYGAAAALAVVVVGGAFYFFDRSDTAPPAAPTEAANPPAAAKPATKPAAPAGNPDDAAVPSAAQTDQLARLLGAARRLAQDGNFDGAKAVLDRADTLMPGSADTAAVRREITQLSTPQGQLALQLDRARSAIAQDDSAAAEKALAQAERLSPQAPEIASLRQTLKDAQQQQAHRSDRVTELLKEMRDAIARHDFKAANSAFNEAERINVRDPSIEPARVELAKARNAEEKRNAQQ